MNITGIPKGLTEALRKAQHVAVLTGAGVSAESGVPTFRDAQQGLWAKYDPADLATPEAFPRNPQLVWAWYDWRRKLVTEVTPNAGHLALVKIEKRVPQFTLITQNVDGLHQRAGSRGVIELHGNIGRMICFNEGTVVEKAVETGDVLPRCPNCGGLVRPDVVWFGEPLPQLAIKAAAYAARSCDLFFSISTSAVVQPAASLLCEAIRRGAVTVEINPPSTPLTNRVTYALPGSSDQVLPALVQAAWP